MIPPIPHMKVLRVEKLELNRQQDNTLSDILDINRAANMMHS